MKKNKLIIIIPIILLVFIGFIYLFYLKGNKPAAPINNTPENNNAVDNTNNSAGAIINNATSTSTDTGVVTPATTKNGNILENPTNINTADLGVNYNNNDWEKTDKPGVYVSENVSSTVYKFVESEFIDSDKDGLGDSDEIKIYKTDSNKADTDGDGLSDGSEINDWGSNPLKADTNGDGINDGDSVNREIRPTTGKGFKE